MDKIADFLIQKETITGKEFMKIFREVKGLPDPDDDTKQDDADSTQPAEAPQEPTPSSLSSEEAGAPTTTSNNEPEA